MNRAQIEIAKGNRVYRINGILMYVKHFNGSYRASSNDDLTFYRIKSDLPYRPTFEEAVSDMVVFAQKYGLQEVTE